MTSNIPRILSIDVQHPMRLVLRFDTAPSIEQAVSLAGWIKRGGVASLSPRMPMSLRAPPSARLAGNVTWDEDEGDLAIDSVHLQAFAAEQNPFTGADAVV